MIFIKDISYNRGEYWKFETDDIILKAIETITKDNILDRESIAYRIWNTPTEKEIAVVRKVIKKNYRGTSKILNWGCATLDL